MNSRVVCFLLLSYAAEAIRLNGMEAKKSNSRVDTVIVMKTLDSGSTFLDEEVFPKLPHVSRWGQEMSEVYKNDLPQLAEWFGHKQGEEIVGGSLEFQAFGAPSWGENFKDWYTNVGSHFTREKHGDTLFIKLYRHPVAKWVSILRAEALQNTPCNECLAREADGAKICDKKNIHLPECSAKKATIDAKRLYESVAWDDEMHGVMDDAMARSMKDKSDVFVAKEVFTYQELLECQGIPQRINRHLGNDVDGCNHKSAYLREHPLRNLHEVVENHEEIRDKFKGTKWEDAFESDDSRFFMH